MSNGNTVTLVGNVTRDPELRFTNTGQATATFGLAVNRMWNDRQTNERRESTSFFDIVCWREMAENVSESLQKGARVLVTGRLEQRSWETPEGDRRSKIEVIADEVGPSLRWATAEVRKNDRRGPSDGPSGGGGQGGYSSPSGQGGYSSQGGQQRSSAGSGDPGPTYDYGEEPF